MLNSVVLQLYKVLTFISFISYSLQREKLILQMKKLINSGIYAILAKKLKNKTTIAII